MTALAWQHQSADIDGRPQQTHPPTSVSSRPVHKPLSAVTIPTAATAHASADGARLGAVIAAKLGRRLTVPAVKITAGIAHCLIIAPEPGA